MIALAEPRLLLLAVPWLLAWWLFARLQFSAFRAVEGLVDERFRGHFTRHSRRSLGWHLGLLLALGLLLILAAARPGIEGRGELTGSGQVLLLIDASASMYAEDALAITAAERAPDDRFGQARWIAGELSRRLEGMEIALATFSGTTAINLPMTRDRDLLAEALRVLETHSYYRGTGSSFNQALDLAFHFFRPENPDLQVVVISDGEMPTPESFETPLSVLAMNGIPVHAIAVGSERGQKRQIFDFNDVVAGRKPPRVIRRFTTQRVDEHLEAMAARTGGRFGVASATAIDSLEEAILDSARRPRAAARDELRTELTAAPLLLFLLGYLFEALVPWPRRRTESFEFDFERIGEPPRTPQPSPAPTPSATAVLSIGVLGILLLATACDKGLQRQAHHDNERGIALDAIGRHRAARRHYERSLAAGIRPQIPTYNLARSLTLAGDYAEAHEKFQQALRIEPGLREAFFNDGVALYRWGAAERDPKNCQLERTLELWEGALRRFETVARGDLESTPLGDSARADREFLIAEIAALRALVAAPPADCGRSSSASEGAAAGGGGQAGGARSPGGSEDGEPGSSGAGAPEAQGGEPGEHGGDSRQAPTGAGGELSESQLEAIGQALERIAQQAQEAGKYHRRTLPEQFRKDDWSNPDPVLWW